MILVRLSAEDERIINGAETEAELQGVQKLLQDRIEAAKVLRVFNKAPTVKPRSFRYQEAAEIAREVLGNTHVIVPPYPTQQWYARVNLHIKQFGMDADYIRKLAEYARDNLMMPVNLDFLISNHARVLAGAFDRRKRGNSPNQAPHPSAGWMADRLPDD